MGERSEREMINVKCGREEVELTENDEIMYNGACYQIVSRGSFFKPNPILAKSKAEKLIKDGDLVLGREEKRSGMKLEFYIVNPVSTS